MTPKTVIRSGFGIFYAGIFSDLGGQVLFPGYTVEQTFNNLGTGIAQPFKLSQGLPAVATNNCAEPCGEHRSIRLREESADSHRLQRIHPGQSSSLCGAMEFRHPEGDHEGHDRGSELRRNPRRSPSQSSYRLTQCLTILPLMRPSLVPTRRWRPSKLVRIRASEPSTRSTWKARPAIRRCRPASAANTAPISRLSRTIRGPNRSTMRAAFITSRNPPASIVGQFPQQFLGLNKGLSEFDRPNDFTAAILYRTSGQSLGAQFRNQPDALTRIAACRSISGKPTRTPAQAGTNQQRPYDVTQASVFIPGKFPTAPAFNICCPLAPPTSRSSPPDLCLSGRVHHGHRCYRSASAVWVETWFARRDNWI